MGASRLLGVASALALVMLPVASYADAARPAHGLPLPARISASSYFGQHSQRVEAAMLVFQSSIRVDEEADRLGFFRDRDRLRLRHPAGIQEPPSAAIGSTLFAGAVILAAHAPQPLRFIIDSSTIHLGPSVCDTGGVGMAVGGRF